MISTIAYLVQFIALRECCSRCSHSQLHALSSTWWSDFRPTLRTLLMYGRYTESNECRNTSCYSSVNSLPLVTSIIKTRII